jgi:hypothetical protein
MQPSIQSLHQKQLLQSQIDKLRGELRDLEAAENEKLGAALVGQCFRYRNCYSCPGPDDYWFMYMKVTGIDAEGKCLVTSFQIDKDGEFQFRPNQPRTAASIYGESISATKFNHELDVFLRRMQSHCNGIWPGAT